MTLFIRYTRATENILARKPLFCCILILCLLSYYYIYIFGRWTPPKCSILFSKERELKDFEWWHTGCPNIGGGPQGVVVTALTDENLSNNVWVYLSIVSVAKRYDNWPAAPRDLLHKLHEGGFTPLTITSLEDLANRCQLNHLLEEYKKAKIIQDNKKLFKAMEYKENKNVTLVILPKLAIEKEALIQYWLQFSNMINFKDELVTYSCRTIENEIINQKISSKTSKSNDYVGVHVSRADDNEDKLIEFYLRAMSEMRQRLRPRRAVFVVICDNPEWCRKYLQASDVIVTDHESPGRDLSLLAACNHTIFTSSSSGLTAAIFNTKGMTIIQDSKSKNESSSVDLYFAKHLPNWIIMD